MCELDTECSTAIILFEKPYFDARNIFCLAGVIQFDRDVANRHKFVELTHLYNYQQQTAHLAAASILLDRTIQLEYQSWVSGVILQIIKFWMSIKKLTLQRLMKQEAALEKQPITNAIVTREDTLKFHFCLYNLEGPYAGGFYHGLLELHENYPFAAPKLIFFTPSGRFDVNLPICTSFTNYHQQSWTSAWNVRTLILATVSFMYSEEPSYGCRQDSNNERIRMAQASMDFNLKNPLFVSLFEQKLISQKLLSEERLAHKNLQSLPNYSSYVSDEPIVGQINKQEFQEVFQHQHDKVPNNRNRLATLLKGVGVVIIIAGLCTMAYKFL